MAFFFKGLNMGGEVCEETKMEGCNNVGTHDIGIEKTR